MLARQPSKESSMGTRSTGLTLAPISPPPVANEEGNSEGTSTAKATQDRHRRTHLGHNLRSRYIKRKVTVMPTVVVDGKDRPFFRAVLKGDWKKVQQKVSQNSEAIVAKVMTVKDKPVTVLQVAIIAAHDQLVENLVKLLPPKYEDENLNEALYEAARVGRIRMVKALVEKIDFGPENLALALSTAISWAPMQKELLWYLVQHEHTPAPDDDTLNDLIMAGHMDILFFLECRYHMLVTTEDPKFGGILEYLVSMMSYFQRRARLGFWEKIVYKCIPPCLVDESVGKYQEMKSAPDSFIKRIVEPKLRHKWLAAFGNLALLKKMATMDIPAILEFLLTSDILIEAASHGISEFVKLCLKYFPELMWEKDFTKELIKEVVKGRHVELFRLLKAHNLIDHKNDKTRRSLMEAVVEWSPGCAPADVSGAAFLIQRELQWFKVVEDMSDPSFKSLKFEVSKEGEGSDPSSKSLKLVDTEERRGKTYWEIFVEQRQDLLKEAGQWMKDTSSSCSVIATLIITVAFTTAFTVPGGNDSGTGIPIFLKRSSFIVFAIADAFALFSSVTATLMFFAILTSRYAIEDFVKSLPRKMILGLTFLFLSLAFMLVAFSSALTIVLSERLKWIYIPITLLAAFPIVLFAILQLPLYVEMVKSTYCPPLRRPLKIWG